MSEFSFKLPDLGEGIVESEIVEWHIAIGDSVKKDQHIADIQTDKAVVEATTPVAGKVIKLGCDAGEMLAVGSELVLFDTEAIIESSKVNRPENKPQKNTAVQKNLTPQGDINRNINSDSNILTSPSVRLRARQNNIDLHNVEGHGPKGRIDHQDLDDFLSGTDTTSKTDTQANSKTNAIPKAADKLATTKASSHSDTDIKRYPLKGTRRIIAQKLQQAYRNIPHYSYIEEVDVTQLERQRETLNKNRTAQQNKLTLLPFIIQALVKALPQYPHCNAHFNEESHEVTEYASVHTGIATMTDAGLMVPVIKNCEQKTLWQYAEEIQQLATAAKDKTISGEQLTGSTITITSLGKLGGIASTPIINAPETCIIGINKIQKKPVVIDDAIAIHSVMNISASFDHRVVDGFDGASLVQAIKTLLENPEQ